MSHMRKGKLGGVGGFSHDQQGHDDLSKSALSQINTVVSKTDVHYVISLAYLDGEGAKNERT